MQLSVTERERLYAILEKYDQNPKVQQMREFIQHGDVTTCLLYTSPSPRDA